MRMPAVRLVAAPPLEPPFDDQRGIPAGPVAPGQGAQLTLKWRVREDPPPIVSTPGAGTSVAGTSGASTPGDLAPPTAPPGASPAAWHAALRFLDRCQEILNGYRPAAHARPMSAPQEAQDIVDHLTAVARRTRVPAIGPGGRAVGPARVVRRRVHVCEPRPGAVEAMAVLSQADRSWAVAFRLERRGMAWLCTTFTDVVRRP